MNSGINFLKYKIECVYFNKSVERKDWTFKYHKVISTNMSTANLWHSYNSSEKELTLAVDVYIEKNVWFLLSRFIRVEC